MKVYSEKQVVIADFKEKNNQMFFSFIIYPKDGGFVCQIVKDGIRSKPLFLKSWLSLDQKITEIQKIAQSLGLKFDAGELRMAIDKFLLAIENGNGLRRVLEEKREKPQAFKDAMEIIEELMVETFIEQSEREPYITLCIKDGDGKPHFENYPIKSSRFSSLLNALYYKRYGKGLRDEVRKDVQATLEALAFNSKKLRQLELFGYVDEAEKKILVDTGLSNWSAIEITPNGWQIIIPNPNPFKRTIAIAPLPEPVKVDNPLDVLQTIIPGNIDDRTVKVNGKEIELKEVLMKVLPVWIASIPLTHIPRPMVLTTGPHGSGKSSFNRRIQKIFTALDVQIFAARDERDIILKLHLSPVVCFDNVNYISRELADIIAASITGGQQLARKLFTDKDPIIFELKRVVCINGIHTNVSSYADLMDRTIPLPLRRLDEKERKEERELDLELEQIKPKVLGAIFTALSKALPLLDGVREELREKIPVRMVDWVIWGEAIARGLGMAPWEFTNAYLALVQEATMTVLEDNPLAKAITYLKEGLKGINEGLNEVYRKKLVEDKQETLNDVLKEPEEEITPETITKYIKPGLLPLKAKNFYIGTPTQLLRELEEQFKARNEEVLYDDGFPRSPQRLSKLLRELQPNLSEIGVKIGFDRISHDRTRIIKIVIEGEEEEKEGGGERPTTEGEEQSDSFNLAEALGYDARPEKEKEDDDEPPTQEPITYVKIRIIKPLGRENKKILGIDGREYEIPDEGGEIVLPAENAERFLNYGYAMLISILKCDGCGKSFQSQEELDKHKALCDDYQLLQAQDAKKRLEESGL